MDDEEDSVVGDPGSPVDADGSEDGIIGDDGADPIVRPRRRRHLDSICCQGSPAFFLVIAHKNGWPNRLPTSMEGGPPPAGDEFGDKGYLVGVIHGTWNLRTCADISAGTGAANLAWTTAAARACLSSRQ
eukprot:9497478-Pyramimonas_sp.AAC.2